jgi:GMP synthase (glutamine-hydrolysing)
VSVAPLLVVQLDATDPVGRLGLWLTEAGLELDVRDTADGAELPPELGQHSGLLVLGGRMGASDDDVAPVLPHVRALLREAVSAEVPTLGVCLGHQMLAVAHGGRVERNPDGPEIGAQLIAKRSAAAGDPLFAALPITPDVLQWHKDAVTVLPPGAIQLASSPLCDQQAFRLGRLAWGIQFHIETTPEMVRWWAAEHEAEHAAEQSSAPGNGAGLDLPTVLSRAVAAHDDIEEVWQPFAAAFAAVVRDPDSVAPPRGVPTSTAAPLTDPAAIRAALAAEATSARAPLPMPGLRPPGND